MSAYANSYWPIIANIGTLIGTLGGLAIFVHVKNRRATQLQARKGNSPEKQDSAVHRTVRGPGPALNRRKGPAPSPECRAVPFAPWYAAARLAY